jgi:hypothetical protein
MMLLVGLCVLGAILPQAKADEGNRKTTLSFRGPVGIPGQVFPAGTYVLKLADSQAETRG